MVGVGGLLVMEKVGINDDFMKDVFVGDLGLAPITNLVNREEPIDGLDWIGLDWMGLALTGGLSEEERRKKERRKKKERKVWLSTAQFVLAPGKC